MHRSLFLLFCLLLAIKAGAQKPACRILKQEFLFETGSAFKQCHAATIDQAADGTLMACWFGGSHEGNKDVVIWGARYSHGRWSKPEVWADGLVSDSVRYPCWNPVLFRADKERTMYLYYKVGENPRKWWGMVKTSQDGGRSWSKPHALPRGISGPIKNRPVELAGGRIVSPSSRELSEARWIAHAEISNDRQQTWTSFPMDTASAFNVIQPSLLVHKDGRLQALCRSRERVVVTTWSADTGKTWSSLTATSLVNPNSAIDAISAGNLFLIVYNPSQPGDNWWDGRSELRLAYSNDGIAWYDLLSLEHEPQGEFSYPTLFKDRKGNVHIVYTYKRQNIKHWVLQLTGL